MTPELAYFLKINVAIALFYAFYRLFFHKDTFFHWRRIALLCFFAISLLYPLLNIEGWIKAHEPMVAMADLYATIILPEQVVTIPQETEINWQELIKLLTGIIYWSGVLLLTARFFLQLGSIMRLHFQCSKSQLKGVRVHLLKKEAGPFSFFHWIFINPMQYSDKEINEILIHEQTHVRELHSLDIILVQLVILLCWFNPFSWLIRSEIRMNHEYLECMKSFLSVLLSGTPAQVKPLIPSAENGLFSRQLFYRMPPIDEWADQFEQGDEDMDSLFSDWGRQWKKLVDYLHERVNVIQFHLSDTQKERFNSCFARIFGHAGLSYGYPMRSSVARIAINICRIASVVAFLRSVESLLIPQAILDSQFSILNCPGLSPAPEIPEENVRDGIVPSLELRIDDNDFQAVLSLVEPLYRHCLLYTSPSPRD